MAAEAEASAVDWAPVTRREVAAPVAAKAVASQRAPEAATAAATVAEATAIRLEIRLQRRRLPGEGLAVEETPEEAAETAYSRPG